MTIAQNIQYTNKTKITSSSKYDHTTRPVYKFTIFRCIQYEFTCCISYIWTSFYGSVLLENYLNDPGYIKLLFGFPIFW